jgi:hypothetical protein
MTLPRIGLGATSLRLVALLLAAACGGGTSTFGAPPAPDAGEGSDAAPATEAGPPLDAGSDGGADSAPVDGAPADAAPDDASSFCSSPPSDLAACTTTDDCAIVLAGCYCGSQPEYGVAKKYASQERACETAAANMCALGCVNFPGHRAQDGHNDLDGGTIAVRCAAADGGGNACTTYVSGDQETSGAQ